MAVIQSCVKVNAFPRNEKTIKFDPMMIDKGRNIIFLRASDRQEEKYY
jgi:hypothetical protein